jgi:hypothetical protein
MRESVQVRGMTRTMRRFGFFAFPAVALVSGLMAVAATPALAAPLGQQACEELQARLDGLRRDGVEADMALGPAVARTSLPIDRFNRIGAYIETEEQLNFRCGLAKQHIVLPNTVEGGEEELPGPGEVKVEGTSKIIALPQRAPVDRRTPPTAATSAAFPLPEPKPARKAPQPAPAKAVAKKKRPAKADDAYRPPRNSTTIEKTSPGAVKQ